MFDSVRFRTMADSASATSSCREDWVLTDGCMFIMEGSRRASAKPSVSSYNVCAEPLHISDHEPTAPPFYSWARPAARGKSKGGSSARGERACLDILNAAVALA